jgi:glycosyltransferase involved in cell wall biosynthesis
MREERKLRIGIDLTGLWRPATGVFVYAIELAHQLLRLDNHNSYTLFFTGEVQPNFRELHGKFRSVVIPVRDEVISKQLVLGTLCNTLQLDVMHFPAFPPALACFRPFIWTLHDATPWLYPETMNWKSRLYFGHLGARAARSSKAIITVSNEAKRNIIEALRVPESKVRVIYEGVDGAFRKIDEHAFLNSVRARYRLPERFLLTVGTLEPRKNLPFLIRAYKRFRELTDAKLGLVIVGRKGWKSQAIDQSLAEAGDGVVVTGFIPREDLVGLYNLADAFVLPSLYEGFGFPPLEAMACGCPVIVSNRGSLPEIVGDAALLIDPTDIDSLVGALRSVFSNPRLGLTLVGKGLARVKRFSWGAAASETLGCYRETVNSREDLVAAF